MLVILQNNAGWDCFKTPILQEILRIQNLKHQVEHCAFLEVIHLFHSVGCVRSKLLSHTVRRKLRLFLLMQVCAWMGFQLLICGIWLLKCSIFPHANQRSPKIEHRETCFVIHHQTSTSKIKPRLQSSTTLLNCVDSFSSNAKSSEFGAMLYILEDNEAVIKMIIKGRSPTMRHVSRIHRVALDWRFDRINLDPKNQIKYVDTKHQLAVMLTEENFTRDEWNRLLHLFNISQFSFICCAQNFSSTGCPETMAKRIQ